MIKYLKNIYYGAFVWFNIVEFKPNENLVRSTTGAWSWKQDFNLENWEYLQDFGIRKVSVNRLKFVSKTKVKAIILDQFPYPYRIKRVCNNSFHIDCKSMQEYFENNDTIRILVRQ